MRTGLTLQQTNILNSDTKKVFWLFEIDQDGDGNVDYYWSTAAKTYDGQAYDFKIMGFDPLLLNAGFPELGIIPPTEIKIRASFPDGVIDGLYASDFDGSSITVKLVCGANLEAVIEPGGGTDEVVTAIDYEESEIMSWRFNVVTATSKDQVLTLKCQDWFTLMLEGDYPNTPLVSELFPADIMKNDNVCTPLAFGTPFFPIRWITKTLTATYVDADTFTVAGDQRGLFSAGQFLLAQCGVDGIESCWVESSSYTPGSPGTTTVNLAAGSGTLTDNLTGVSTDHYVLGPADKTYTIDRARTPQQVNFKTTYQAADYTFKQDTLTGSDGINYKVIQLLCDDADKDGTNDANGFWGIIGKEIYDLPCRFSRSDLVAKTNPADIASWVFQDWGIPADEIDATSQAAAAAIFTARSFSLNIGLWYRLTREEFISKLFTVSGMIPLYRDKIGFKVLTKTSQLTITEDMVDPGSFNIGRTYTQKEKDSGYVTWQTAADPVDQVNKTVIAVKSSTDKRADETIEAEWVLDSVKAQKAGKLALQRILLRDKTITFTANGKILVLEPGDMITISPQNLGAEGSSYVCRIEKMHIREGLCVDVECIRFSDSLDDWDDLTASSIVVGEAATDRGYSPVYQGGSDASGSAGDSANIITQTVMIGSGGILATNSAPETNGGFKATDTELACYNTSGHVRFKAIYAGDDQGDVELGDYTGGKGIKWDQSDSKLHIKVNATGGVSVSGGGDITLTGSDTDPGRIKFAGTSYSVEIGGDADGNRFLIKPDTNDAIDLYIGSTAVWWGEGDSRFQSINLESKKVFEANCGDYVGAVNGAYIYMSANLESTTPILQIGLYDKTAQTLMEYYFLHAFFGPNGHKTQDLGRSSDAWDDAYADDWHDVADFFFLDHRREDGMLTPVNDMEVIKAIKPGGIFDPRTGLELIDDNTLPEWLLSKCKKTGAILRDPDGKPYLSLKLMISLLMGAIRQIDERLQQIEQK